MRPLTAEETRLRRWFRSIARVPLRDRTFWRCIERAFAATALESGPSFGHDTRYGVKLEFSALYLSESRELARLEKTQGAQDLFEPLEDMRLRCAGEVEVPDLTDPDTLAGLKDAAGIAPADLVAVATPRYERTHRMARAAFHEGVAGLLVPSAHRPTKADPSWRNLVLYPTNIVGGLFVRG